MTQVLGYHPSYLPQFMKMHNFLMRGNGPLPLHIRNYLAILVNFPTPLPLLSPSSLPPSSLFLSLSLLYPSLPSSSPYPLFFLPLTLFLSYYRLQVVTNVPIW